MHHELYIVTDLLTHLLLPPAKITEGFFRVGSVSLELAKRVQVATGLQVRGFEVVLDRSGIQHSFKQHGVGNAASEIAQGQGPIEAADFLALPEWLPAPEAVRPGQLRPGRQPMPCVEFYATLPSGLTCAILEFRPGRKRLALVTMYKKNQPHEQLVF